MVPIINPGVVPPPTSGMGQQAHSPSAVLQQVVLSAQATDWLHGTRRDPGNDSIHQALEVYCCLMQRPARTGTVYTLGYLS